MFCSTLLGFFVGVVIVKAFRRWFYFRMGYGGRGGYGYGHCDRCDRDGHNGWNGHGYWRYRDYGPGSGSRYAPTDTPQVGRPLDALIPGLELNERQQAEAAPLFALIKARLGNSGPRVEAALSVLAAERFDKTPLQGLISELPEGLQRELYDGLEHVHTILISEQREYLRKELAKQRPTDRF